MQVLRAAGYSAVPDGEPDQSREHLRADDLPVGTYCIPVGGKDGQQPHSEHERHQFTEVAEDLSVLVLFTPAERSRP